MTIIISGWRAQDLARLVAEDWRESGKPVVTHRNRVYKVTNRRTPQAPHR